MSDRPWFAVRKQFFYPTKDDWKPNYSGDRVLVRVSEAWHPDHKYAYNLLMSIWGAGDFGLYRWFKADIFNLARKRRKLIQEAASLPQPVSLKTIREMGFYFANLR